MIVTHSESTGLTNRAPSPIPSITMNDHRRGSQSTHTSEDKVVTKQRSYPTLNKKSLSDMDDIGSDGSFSVLPSTAESSTHNISRRANEKRNNDFHNLFRSVPDQERLIDDYGCALHKEILLQGRIYMSESHLCFNANIFGWITNLVIAFDDIEDIEKKATAIIIPNAILISTSTSKHFFGSFLSRDQAYDQMVDLWKANRHNNAIQRELGDQGGINPEYSDEDYSGSSYYSDSEEENDVVVIQPPPIDNEGDLKARQSSLASLPVPKHLSSAAAEARRRAVSEAGARPNMQEFIKKNSDNSKSTPSLQHIPSENAGVNDTIKKENEQVKEVTECECHKSTGHFPIVVMDNKYNTTIDTLYNLLYNSPFMQTFLSEIEKSTEINIGQWIKGNDNQSTRESSYIKYLGSTIGPKSTKCYLKEDMIYLDKANYLCQLTVTQTPDVPSGGSFTVKTRTCITWCGVQQVRVLVTVLVDFTKSSWLKSTIEKASIDGQQQYYKNLDAAVRNYLDKHAVVDPKKRKGRRHKRRERTVKPEAMVVENGSMSILTLCQDIVSNIVQWLLSIKSPSMPQLTVLCMGVMVITNFYIAYKMSLVDHQLSHIGRQPIPSVHSSRNDDSLWSLLSRMDPDTNEKKSGFQPRNTNSNDVPSESIEFSESTKYKLDKQMMELEKMIKKAGQNMEHVNSVVQEQKKKIVLPDI
ncbi:hypothetical protein BDB01DRAFT_853908 [Pilobolus umbonatus]|nr:hypothetical protein BDB01DRAFT_853908 [Pilobolus umbonatus]